MSEYSELAKDDISYHLHPQTNFRQHEELGPKVIVEGDGVWITDEHGQRYMEAMSGLWCTSLGFSEKRLADAAYRQLTTLPYQQTFAHRSSRPVISLARKLIEKSPVPMAKVMFQTSGSEAIDTAIKFTWYYHHAIGKPEKKKIIGRKRGYHGTTIAAAALTGLPNMHSGWGNPSDYILHVTCPHFYREGKTGESEAEFCRRLADELETLILNEGPDTIAAFFAEPVMGTGGVIVPPEGYFPAIQAVLRKYDILLVADEVICGFGRTGSYWGSQRVGMQPDMLACAKGLSSAYAPISALLINDRIYQAIAEQSRSVNGFGHGFTYGGHPVSAAVALETLNIYDQDDILGQVAKTSPLFCKGFQALAMHPLVGESRSIGLMGALEFVANKETRAVFAREQGVAQRVSAAAEKRGVLIRALGDSLVCAPPLIINEQEIDFLLRVLNESLNEVHHELITSC